MCLKIIVHPNRRFIVTLHENSKAYVWSVKTNKQTRMYDLPIQPFVATFDSQVSHVFKFDILNSSPKLIVVLLIM